MYTYNFAAAMSKRRSSLHFCLARTSAYVNKTKGDKKLISPKGCCSHTYFRLSVKLESDKKTHCSLLVNCIACWRIRK